jgi:hypothetical protein
MLEYLSSNYIPLAMLILIFVLLFILIILLLNRRKELTLSFKVSETSQKRISDLIAQEMKPAIVEANQKIRNFAETIIASYQEQTEELMQTLNKQGDELLKNFFEENKKIKKNIQELNQKIENDFLELHKKIIDKQKEIYALGEENLSQEILNIRKEHQEVKNMLLEEAKKDIQISGDQFIKRLSPVYQEAVKDIEQKISLTQEEIKGYKDKRFKELDKEIYQKLGQIAKETIGEILDLSSHEELIKKALEKAKKEIL